MNRATQRAGLRLYVFCGSCTSHTLSCHCPSMRSTARAAGSSALPRVGAAVTYSAERELVGLIEVTDMIEGSWNLGWRP